jgi:hypothetical protein
MLLIFTLQQHLGSATFGHKSTDLSHMVQPFKQKNHRLKPHMAIWMPPKYIQY